MRKRMPSEKEIRAKMLLIECLNLLEEGEKGVEYTEDGPQYFWRHNERGKIYQLINDLAEFLESD